MKSFTLSILTLLFSFLASAQKTDSIKYANGYLYFHEYGAGEAIILLTGGPGANYQQLEEVAINLGRHKRIILLEQRGSGRSMPRPFDASTINLKTAHADLDLLLDHLKLKEARFMGHSWGAMLAMSYAAAKPAKVKALILLDPGPFKLDAAVFDTYASNQSMRFAPGEIQNKDAALKQMQSPTATKQDSASYYKWELLPAIYNRSMLDSMLVKINKGGLNPATGGLLFQSLGREGFDLSKPLASFKKPVHVISGAQDPGAFISYEIKILLPHAQLHWINEAGHFPMYEQPTAFYAIIESILK